MFVGAIMGFMIGLSVVSLTEELGSSWSGGTYLSGTGLGLVLGVILVEVWYR